VALPGNTHIVSRAPRDRQPERNAPLPEETPCLIWGFFVAVGGVSRAWVLASDCFSGFFDFLRPPREAGGVGSVAPVSAEGEGGFLKRSPFGGVGEESQEKREPRTDSLCRCGGACRVELGFELKRALAPSVAFFGRRFRCRARVATPQFENVCCRTETWNFRFTLRALDGRHSLS
jgi:hypothetical protein